MLVLLFALIGHAVDPPEGAERVAARAVDAGIVELGQDGRITLMVEGGPAWEAGVRPGETIVRIDGLRVARMSADEVYGRLAPMNDQLTLQVARGGGTEQVKVEIKAYDPLNSVITTGGDEEQGAGVFWCEKGNCRDGNGLAKHSSGATYLGYFKDGLADGFGVWKTPDGIRYEGGFKEGLREGPGALRDTEKNLFAGIWRRGQADGPFSVTWADGRTYEGFLRARVPHGRGVQLWPDGRRYEGEFDYGDFHGEGRLEMPSGERYVGAFQNNLAHGKGSLDMAQGDHLEGTFYKGRLEGEGLRRWSDDGREYVGTFTKNEPNGIGVLTWPDGRKHLGTFVEGEPQGLGVHVWPGAEGKRVVASFTDENRGIGYILDGTDKVVYEGWIVRGMAEGWGRELKENGEFRRYRFYFNNKPRGDHPRGLRLGQQEKKDHEAFDWTPLEALKQVRSSREELDAALGE